MSRPWSSRFVLVCRRSAVFTTVLVAHSASRAGRGCTGSVELRSRRRRMTESRLRVHRASWFRDHVAGQVGFWRLRTCGGTAGGPTRADGGPFVQFAAVLAGFSLADIGIVVTAYAHKRDERDQAEW